MRVGRAPALDADRADFMPRSGAVYTAVCPILTSPSLLRTVPIGVTTRPVPQLSLT